MFQKLNLVAGFVGQYCGLEFHKDKRFYVVVYSSVICYHVWRVLTTSGGHHVLFVLICFFFVCVNFILLFQVIPNYSSKDQYDKMFALGVTMYGQMTAGSYCYIGPQGIVHGTTVSTVILRMSAKLKKSLPPNPSIHNYQCLYTVYLRVLILSNEINLKEVRKYNFFLMLCTHCSPIWYKHLYHFISEMLILY